MLQTTDKKHATLNVKAFKKLCLAKFEFKFVSIVEVLV